MTNMQLADAILGKLIADLGAGWKSENGLFNRLREFIVGLQLDPTIPNDDLLNRLEECLDNYSDVNDGDSGPVANRAMSMLDELRQWRKASRV